MSSQAKAGGYMVAFAGRKYAARSPPILVADDSNTITSFTLVHPPSQFDVFLASILEAVLNSDFCSVHRYLNSTGVFFKTCTGRNLGAKRALGITLSALMVRTVLYQIQNAKAMVGVLTAI